MSRQKDYALLESNGSRVPYSAQYKQHCTPQAFKQFKALYIHNINDKHQTQPHLKWVSSQNLTECCKQIQMAISTNQKPTIYRNLYENTGPGVHLNH